MDLFETEVPSIAVTVFLMLLCTSVICSCGQKKFVDPSLAPYVTKFTEDGCGKVTTGYIGFANIEPAGKCLITNNPITGDEQKEIRIDKDYFFTLSELQKQTLINHELLHCERVILDLYEDSDSTDWMYYMVPPASKAAETFAANLNKYCK
jgi:hypothetical protein